MLMANQISEWAFFFGVALMIAILMRRYFRYFGKLKREKKKKKPAASSIADERSGVEKQTLLDAPDNVLRWQVDMHDTARNLKAELDTKIGLLQTLVQMADDRIGQLNSLAERTRSGASSSEPSGGSSSDAVPSEFAEIPARQSTATRSKSKDDSTGIGLPGNDDMRRSIYQLADRGLDARQISNEIGRSLGDIEFILALRTAE
jgi:hypothetical protein